MMNLSYAPKIALLVLITSNLALSTEMDADAKATMEFWTPERFASAQPMRSDKDGFSINQHTTAEGGPVQLEDAVMPGGQGNPFSHGSGNIRKRRSLQNLVLDEAFDFGGAASLAIGRIFFSQGEDTFICSGTVIRDGVSGRSLILTAAHCVSESQSDNIFHENFLFIPAQDDGGADFSDFNCENDPFGCWVPNAAYVDRQYFDKLGPGFENLFDATRDYALLVVNDEGRFVEGYFNTNPALDQAVPPLEVDFTNSLGVSVDPPFENVAAYTGYPGDRDPDLRFCFGPTNGRTFFYENSTFSLGPWIPGGDHAIDVIGCNLGGGSSGGPGLTTPDSKIFSVASIRASCDYLSQQDICVSNMFGPLLYDNSFSCLFEQAGSDPITPLFQGAAHSYGGIPCIRSARGFGDPHFEDWSGKYFDYHGACDLVLAETPTLDEQNSFAAHVRTKSRGEYSYIEAAAIKIGDDILEVGEYGFYAFNGVVEGELGLMGGMYKVTQTVLATGSRTASDTKDFRFDIHLEGDSVITVKAHKDLVSVGFSGARKKYFEDVVGLLGDFQSGNHYSRLGGVMEDLNEFGEEWHVRPAVDGNLFLSKSPVEYPAKCIVPAASLAQDRARRLAESSITLEDATRACANFASREARAACIYDVMATNDLGASVSGGF